MSEASFQGEIMNALCAYDVFFWRQNCGRMEDARGRWVQFTSIDGISDIIGFGGPHGRFFGIEVKSPTGTQKAKQKTFQAACISMNAAYFLAREGKISAKDVAKEIWRLLNEDKSGSVLV